MRKHWSNVRQDSSPWTADRSELMLCVATIGMRRAWRLSAKVRSSPDGSVSPVVAKLWYSSHTNSRSRHGLSGRGGDLGDASEHGPLKVQFQHDAERAGERRDSSPTGKLSASTFPDSSRSSIRGSGVPCFLVGFRRVGVGRLSADKTRDRRSGCRRRARETRRCPRRSRIAGAVRAASSCCSTSASPPPIAVACRPNWRRRIAPIDGVGNVA